MRKTHTCIMGLITVLALIFITFSKVQASGTGAGDIKLSWTTSQIMSGVFILAAIIIFCCVREGRTTGKYQACKVYGRFQAWVVFMAALCTVILIVALCLFDWGSTKGHWSIGAALYLIIDSLIIPAIGIWVFLRCYKRCPSFLRRWLLPNMLLSGCGVMYKGILFIIPLILFPSVEPEKIMLSSETVGREIYRFGMYVYDPVLHREGKLSEDGKEIIWKEGKSS